MQRNSPHPETWRTSLTWKKCCAEGTYWSRGGDESKAGRVRSRSDSEVLSVKGSWSSDMAGRGQATGALHAVQRNADFVLSERPSAD